jgi:hypothetical protein
LFQSGAFVFHEKPESWRATADDSFSGPPITGSQSPPPALPFQVRSIAGWQLWLAFVWLLTNMLSHLAVASY